VAGQRDTDPKKYPIASCGTQIQGWGSDYFAAMLGSSTSGHIVAVHTCVPHKFVNSGTGHARHIDIHTSGRIITGWLDDERPDGGTGGGST
jgi:hypothetical protein